MSIIPNQWLALRFFSEVSLPKQDSWSKDYHLHLHFDSVSPWKSPWNSMALHYQSQRNSIHHFNPRSFENHSNHQEAFRLHQHCHRTCHFPPSACLCMINIMMNIIDLKKIMKMMYSDPRIRYLRRGCRSPSIYKVLSFWQSTPTKWFAPFSCFELSHTLKWCFPSWTR